MGSLLCCLFWFLKFTCGSRESCSPCMLSLGGVHVDSQENPKVISLQLHQTKTDPVQTGVTVFLRKNSHRIAIVSAYPCPLVPIPGWLNSLQRKAALQGSPDTASIRRGPIGSYWAQVQDSAATAAARSGLEDSFVQTLGH